MSNSQGHPDPSATERIVSLLSDIVEDVSGWCTVERMPESSSTAASEEAMYFNDTPSDNRFPTSAKAVRVFLSLYLQAAGQYSHSAAYLLNLHGPDAIMSIRTLARASIEASSLAFWLCEPDIGADERLRRCNQLQVRSFNNAYKNEMVNLRIEPDLSEHKRRASQYQHSRDQALEWAHNRGWTGRSRKSQGQRPTMKQWIGEIPSKTELLGRITEAVGHGVFPGKSVYMSLSGTAHSDHLMTITDSSEPTSPLTFYRAVLALTVSVSIYALLVNRVYVWSGWKFDMEEKFYRVIELLQSLCKQYG